jgi:hypothetical protein
MYNLRPHKTSSYVTILTYRIFYLMLIDPTKPATYLSQLNGVPSKFDHNFAFCRPLCAFPTFNAILPIAGETKRNKPPNCGLLFPSNSLSSSPSFLFWWCSRKGHKRKYVDLVMLTGAVRYPRLVTVSSYLTLRHIGSFVLGRMGRWC